MRITGLATGLDMDSLVKETMRPYRIKIQTQQQKKEIVEIKQKLYREVIKDSREFYNKYFDVSKTDSLLQSKNWATTKFESSDDSVVSVTSTSDAKAGKYIVTGNSAKANSITMTSGIEAGGTIVVNGKEFELLAKGTEKEIAADLNKKLMAEGMNVSVRYTDFAATSGENKKGFIFESTVLGKDSLFTIGGKVENVEIQQNKAQAATATTISGLTTAKLKEIVNAGTAEFKFGEDTISIEIDENDTNETIATKIQTVLDEKDIKFKVSQKDGEITFTAVDTGKLDNVPQIYIGEEQIGSVVDGKDAIAVNTTITANDLLGKSIVIDGKKIDIPMNEAKNGIDIDKLNSAFTASNIQLTAKLDGEKLVLNWNDEKISTLINVNVISTNETNKVETSTGGRDAEITIKDDKGGVYVHKGNSNTVTLDGVTFKFNGEIQADKPITITGKQDITEIKDKLINFINDYNKVIEKLNTVTMERPNRNFSPLTDEQKAEMSEAEIKLWNEKVERGQLSRDSDITRIANSLKSAMKNLVGDNGLEKIGIKPVTDYAGTLNGTFLVEDSLLTKALENNAEDVMNLFISTPAADDKTLTEQQKYEQTGILQRLKKIVYDETVTVKSRLIIKAGIEGSVTSSNNELTRSIEKYEKKMVDMEKDFARREQRLYSQWARVETMMNKLNSQQSNLYSQLGMQ